MTDVVAHQGPTETEMQHIRSIFSRAADAIVSASELAKRVTELEHTMDALKRELDTVKNTNAWLTDQLGNVREHRDRLTRELDEERTKTSRLSGELEDANHTITTQGNRIAELTDKLRDSQKESDDHLLRAMTAEEELQKVRTKLDEAFAWMEGAQKLFKKPEEVASVTPFPTVATDTTDTAHVSEALPHSDKPAPSMVEERTGTDPYRW